MVKNKFKFEGAFNLMLLIFTNYYCCQWMTGVAETPK